MAAPARPARPHPALTAPRGARPANPPACTGPTRTTLPARLAHRPGFSPLPDLPASARTPDTLGHPARCTRRAGYAQRPGHTPGTSPPGLIDPLDPLIARSPPQPDHADPHARHGRTTRPAALDELDTLVSPDQTRPARTSRPTRRSPPSTPTPRHRGHTPGTLPPTSPGAHGAPRHSTSPTLLHALHPPGQLDQPGSHIAWSPPTPHRTDPRWPTCPTHRGHSARSTRRAGNEFGRAQPARTTRTARRPSPSAPPPRHQTPGRRLHSGDAPARPALQHPGRTAHRGTRAAELSCTHYNRQDYSTRPTRPSLGSPFY